MNTSCCQDWRNLHRFDRLYARHLKAFYAEVEERASTIWPGMELCPVCIFRPNGPAFLYGHPDPPPSFSDVGDGLWLGDQAALQLFGATQDDNLLSFLDGGVIAETGENVWEVHSLVFFLTNREQLEIGAGIASVNLDNRHLRWRGEITYESEGKVFLELE